MEMNQKQKERWAKLRAKGARHYVLVQGIGVSALCAIMGHVVWWVLMLIWRGESTPYFIREPGATIAMVIGFTFFGYLQSTREWSKNEREYLAIAESEKNDGVVV